MSSMPRITVRVPKPMKEAGKNRAKELGHPTFSDYVRDLIRDDVGNEAIAQRARMDGRQPDLAETDGGE